MKARESRNRYRWSGCLLAVVVMAAGAFFWSGCGDNPVAPGSNGDRLTGTTGDLKPDEPTVRGGEVRADNGKKVDRRAPKHVTVVVGADGGVIEIPAGRYHSRLTIPSGAVGSPVSITASCAHSANLGGFVALYDFGPDGLVFNKDTELTLDCGDYDGKKMTLFWWDADKGKWTSEDKAEVVDGGVTFRIKHFSKYGIGTDDDDDSGDRD